MKMSSSQKIMTVFAFITALSLMGFGLWAFFVEKEPLGLVVAALFAGLIAWAIRPLK